MTVSSRTKHEQWVTVALDDSVADEKIRFLVDISYELTK